MVVALEGGGTRIRVTTRGASWLSCEVAVGPGMRREVLLGHDQPSTYGTQPGYVGAIVGRYANRIAGARFVDPQGRTCTLSANEGCGQLHGGPDGFDKRDWTLLSQAVDQVTLGLESPAGDQGFPGNLTARVTYAVGSDGAVTIRFDTTVDAPCPVNLSGHAYFNLDGVDAQVEPGDVLDHRLWMAASHYLPIDTRLIPVGAPVPVQATPFDFSQPRHLRPVLARDHAQLALAGGGLDHCFVLDASRAGTTAPVARLTSADGSLGLRLSTSYPGLQCYSGNYLAGLPSRNGLPMARHAGIALEPEYFPDSPNHPDWPQPSCWQAPGVPRTHFIRYEFERSAAPGP